MNTTTSTAAVDVMLNGTVVFGADPQQAAADLSRLTGLPADKALAVITGGQPRLAMQGLTLEHGRAWLQRLTDIGVAASLRESNKPSAQSFGPPPATPASAQGLVSPSGAGPSATPGPQGFVSPPGAGPSAAPGPQGFVSPPGAGAGAGAGVGATLSGTGGGTASGHYMGFGEAIATCFKKYVNCNGRASRSEYWWFELFKWILLFPLFFAQGMAEGMEAADMVPVFKGLGALGLLAIACPSIAVFWRRMQDQDKSGWFILLGLIPWLGGIILLMLCALPGTPGPNRFDEQAHRTSWVTWLGVGFLLLCAVLAAIGFITGDIEI